MKSGVRTLCVLGLLAGSAHGQLDQAMPRQERMPLSTLKELARQMDGVLLATTVRGRCRHFAMAIPMGSGLPIWEIALFSGDVEKKELRRDLLAPASSTSSHWNSTATPSRRSKAAAARAS
ncbi:MAG TPA: hypothetical protein VJ724_14505 [Tahibacter sp.]|nr:hypothetical protein [Tahibacter sp.]